MRSLASVTALCVDTRNHALALAACGRMLPMGFSEVVLATDARVEAFLPRHGPAAERIRIVPIPPIVGRRGYSDYMLRQAADHVRTDHVVIFQWDGFAIDAARWWPGFLDYDYIGAPWPASFPNSGRRVGNGGFSLRSRKLLAAVRALAPQFGDLQEDLVICMRLDERLRREFGIRFAPPEVAKHFSVEHTLEADGRLVDHVSKWGTWGFHGFWNFHLAFTDEEIIDIVDTLFTPEARADMLTRWDAAALLANLSRGGRALATKALARRMAAALGLAEPDSLTPQRVADLVMARVNAGQAVR